MSYIGNPIYQSAFVTDSFSGTGSQTAYTMSVAPAGTTNVLIAVSGVLQDPSTYGVVGNTLTFSAAPPSGTGNISCRYLGVPVTGVTTTAYRTITEFTATAGQTTFTPPSYNVGFINVHFNGVLLGSADYTASNGTTVVLTTGASAGNLVTVESFNISSVANAIPNAAGAVSSSNIVTGVTLTTPTIAGSGLINQSWTTAGRPASPTTGAQGFNSTTGFAEYWNGTQWVAYGTLSATSVQYLVLAGGGGGGSSNSPANSNGGGGGGGAGGYRSSISGESSGGGASAESALTVTPGTSYTITVGAGGAGASAISSSTGTSGSNSVFGSITSVGGGGGSSAGNNSAIGASGGSGGGGGAYLNTYPGSGTSGQGYAGGTQGSGGYSGAGGGGAASLGGNGTGTTAPGGTGGTGVSSSVTGSSVNRAGGGGGGSYTTTASTASGGGGAGGGTANGYVGQNATANYGAGGGGCGSGGGGTAPGNGSSGVVIITYSANYKAATATGTYTQTLNGSNYVYTFTGSGTITF